LSSSSTNIVDFSMMISPPAGGTKKHERTHNTHGSSGRTDDAGNDSEVSASYESGGAPATGKVGLGSSSSSSSSSGGVSIGSGKSSSKGRRRGGKSVHMRARGPNGSFVKSTEERAAAAGASGAFATGGVTRSTFGGNNSGAEGEIDGDTSEGGAGGHSRGQGRTQNRGRSGRNGFPGGVGGCARTGRSSPLPAGMSLPLPLLSLILPLFSLLHKLSV
jgi:hypothetical protein